MSSPGGSVSLYSHSLCYDELSSSMANLAEGKDLHGFVTGERKTQKVALTLCVRYGPRSFEYLKHH